MGTWKRTGRPLQPNEVLVKEYKLIRANDRRMTEKLEQSSLEGWDYVDSWDVEVKVPLEDVKTVTVRKVLLKRVTVKTEAELKRGVGNGQAEKGRVQREGDKGLRGDGAQDRFPRLYDAQGG